MRDAQKYSWFEDERLANFYAGKNVLVTGAGGSIGSAICQQMIGLKPGKLVLLDNSELALFNIERQLENPCVEAVLGDITNDTDLHIAFQLAKPDVIFHAAAYKHVGMCGKNPKPAWRVNFQGTSLLLQYAEAYRVQRLLTISTDKAVRPTCHMGRTKAEAERITLASGYSVIRLGNVYGSSGSAVPLWREQIARGETVTITHPGATRYFMHAPTAAYRIIQAGALARGGEVFVPDMGRAHYIVDVARGLGAKEFKYIGLRPGEKLHEELAVGVLSKTEIPGLFRDAA